MMTIKVLIRNLAIGFLCLFLMLATPQRAWAQCPGSCPNPHCDPNQPAVCGWQPDRITMGPTFDDAATNSLYETGPTYDPIRRGICPDTEDVTVSPSNPIPSVILKAIGLQESSWRQFDCDGDYASEWDWTLMNEAIEGCAYGVMQVVYPGAATWCDSGRLAGEVAYNIGTGTNFLIREKWNNMLSTPTCRQIGENNHTSAEDWYYSVIAYNRWDSDNDPNRSDPGELPYYNPERPPYLEGDFGDHNYPYQERVWGYAAHPVNIGGLWWQPQRIPWVPRGIFGTWQAGNWQPPEWTPRPTFYYLPDIMANWYDYNSDIVIQNPRSDLTLAVDIALYNDWDSTFNQWWLDPPPSNPPPYIRLDPEASRPIAVADRFPTSSFFGSTVIAASQDVSVVVENQWRQAWWPPCSCAYNGIAASDPLNPDWGQVGTTLYAPVITNDYYGWYSFVSLLNAGSATADVNVEYYGPDGTPPVDTDQFLLSPNERLDTTYDGGAEDTLYSARIVSDQPLAAVGFQHNRDWTVFLTYNCLSASDSPVSVYAPVIVNNYYGWDTSVNIQNTGDSSAWVYVRYYNTSGIQVGDTKVDWIPPYASRSRYSLLEDLPDNFIGTARIYSYQQPLAVVVNQSYPRGGSTTRGQSYNGTSSGSTNVVLPDVLNYYGSENWVSSVNVRNLGTSPTVATLTYQSQSVNSPTISPNGFFWR